MISLSEILLDAVGVPAKFCNYRPAAQNGSMHLIQGLDGYIFSCGEKDMRYRCDKQIE